MSIVTEHTARIPAAPVDGLFGAMVKTFARRMMGRVPDSVGVMWNNQAVMKDAMGIGRKAVAKTPSTVRQIAHRAKNHVAARRPRTRVEPSEHERAVQRLVTAFNTGDIQGLMDVLAPDAVSVADGGGKVRGAACRPLVGADAISRYLIGSLAKLTGAISASATSINGQPAMRVELDGVLAGVVMVSVEGGLITRIYSVANPEKLGRVDRAVPLMR